MSDNKTVSSLLEYRKIPVEQVLPSAEIEMLEVATANYEALMGSLGCNVASTRRTILIVHDAIKFAKKAPWLWTGDEINEWSCNLVYLKMTMSTQRHYLGAINRFMRFIAVDEETNRSINDTFGIRVKYEA
jgi:hypothetical protein